MNHIVNKMNIDFNYHGIENVLSGKTRISLYLPGGEFTPKRIVVIQMK